MARSLIRVIFEIAEKNTKPTSKVGLTARQFQEMAATELCRPITFGGVNSGLRRLTEVGRLEFADTIPWRDTLGDETERRVKTWRVSSKHSK